MFYEGAIFRPPSEASSLILQVTVGCRHNQCAFCTMYKQKAFRIKDASEIEAIIEEGYRHYPLAERIFLADGDALTVDSDRLVEILDRLYRRFPRLQRVGIYGGPKNILEKTPEELRRLKEHGLEIVYFGLESGSDAVLRRMRKGVTPEQMIAAGRRVVESGLKLSVTIILGLGGKEQSYEHAIETARVLNAIDPHYLGALTLMLPPDAPLYQEVLAGKFTLLGPWEVLEELELMVEHLELSQCIFRSNHASNYLPLKATFPEDKQALLHTLSQVIGQHRADWLRPESWRGL